MTSDVTNNLNASELDPRRAKLEQCEWVLEGTEEDLAEIKQKGVVAWRESDQGWGGLLCKNRKAYFRLPTDIESLQLPCGHGKEIRSNTLPGWQCIYCGLGRFLILREEYFQRFRELTHSIGNNAELYSVGFDTLRSILKESE